MRIAFETSTVTTHKPTGIAAYATALISELVSLDSQDEHSWALLNKISRLKKKNTQYRHPAMPAHFYLPQISALRHRFDILHSLDAFIPQWAGAKKIVTIHDIYVLINPDKALFPESFVQRKIKSYQNIIKCADRIIAVSQSTKNDIVERLHFPEEKIFITPLGIDREFYKRNDHEISNVREKYNIASNYFLFVGNVTPRKNTERIVQAFNISNCKNDLQLVMCGSLSYNSGPTIETIKKNKLDAKILMLDYVEKSDLPALYSGADGFIYPTLYEGFGIPSIEAMACATPVLTGNLGAAPEVCGDDAILVDPYNIEAIAEGMQQLLQKTDADIIKAQDRAKTYNWRQCAEQTLSAYKNSI